MKKMVVIDNHTIDFNFLERTGSWTTKTVIDGRDTDIEIDFEYHIQPEVDWDQFVSFFNFISESGRLNGLIENSLEPVTFEGQAFFSRAWDAIKDWKMEFSGLYYKGRADETGHHVYSLRYNFIVREGTSIDGDAYGLYLVDMEGLDVVEVRRIQV